MTGTAESPPRRGRLGIVWILVALLATTLVAVLSLLQWTERLDYIVYDNVLSAASRPPPDDIVIVGIDNASLQALGHWPWPRRLHADLLNRLAQARPRAVGYDVLFIEPTADDEALAAAVRRNRTYLPLVVDVPGSNGAPYDIALPSAPLAAAAAGIAHVNLHFEGDRVIRQAYLEEGDGSRSWLQLGAAMAGLHVAAPARRAPGLRQERPILIPYGGATGHIPSFSFIDLLDGRVPAEFLADRYVLIGATADGLGDKYPTPRSGATSQMSGVEIQAHLLDALLRHDAITPAHPSWVLGFALATIWMLLVAGLWLRPRALALLTFLVAMAVVTFTFLLFRLAAIWLPPMPALLGLTFVVSVEAWRERSRLRETLVRERIAAAATEGELQAGRTIQLGLLPPRPDLARIDSRVDVDALLEPAKSIGGDLYDLIRIDDHRLAFVVGDVTGKGVPAALFMALSKALTKSVMLRGIPSLAEAAAILNEELMRDNGESMNVTMLIGIIDLRTGEVMLMSAGHEDPLHLRQDGNIAVHKLDGGPPFCIVDFPYPDEPMKLAPGEALVLISDGVSEALNGTDALFGHERLLAALQGRTTATEMVDAVRDAVRAFENGTDPTDDLTVLAVRYLGS